MLKRYNGSTVTYVILCPCMYFTKTKTAKLFSEQNFFDTYIFDFFMICAECPIR